MSASCAVVCLGTDPYPASLRYLQDQATPCTAFIAHHTRSQEIRVQEDSTHPTQVARWKSFRPIPFAERMNRLLALAFSRWEHEDLDACWVCFLDEDVVLAPGVLDVAIDLLRADVTLGGVCPVVVERRVLEQDEMGQSVFENTDHVQSAGYTLTTQRLWMPLHAGQSTRELPIVPVYVFGGDGRFALFRASALYRAFMQGELFFSWVTPDQAWFELYWRLQWMGERFLCSPHVYGWIASRTGRKRDQAATKWITRSVRALHDPLLLRLWMLPTLTYRSLRALFMVALHPSCILTWMRSWSDFIPRARSYGALRRLRRISLRMMKSRFTKETGA